MDENLYRQGEPLSKEGLFQLVAEEAVKDRKIEDFEKTALNKLARFLQIDKTRAKEVCQIAQKRVLNGELKGDGPLEAVVLYERVLYLVLSDGKIDKLETKMLKGLRALFSLDDHMHEQALVNLREDNGIFLQKLEEYLPMWVKEGLIEEKHRLAILQSFDVAVEAVEPEPEPEPEPEAEAEAEAEDVKEEVQEEPPEETVDIDVLPQLERASALGQLARMLMWIAVILVTVGVFHFYGSNWRYMSPGLKLIQVFTVLLGFYCGAYYCLTKRESQLLLGRALLMLGVLSFGASLGLVAQIFHISSHPSNGVLAWGIVAGAMAWVTYERWAAYLSSILLLIWTIWEWSVYGSANWLFLPVIYGLGYVYFSLERRGGIIFSFLSLLLWILQVCNVYGYTAQAFLIMVAICLIVGFWRKESWLFYLAALALPLWEIGQTVELEGTNYAFIPVLFIVGYAFHWIKSEKGLILTLAEGIGWIYLFNSVQLVKHITSDNYGTIFFVSMLVHISMGLLLLVFGQLIHKYEGFYLFGLWSKFIGGLALLGALLCLSLSGTPAAVFPLAERTVRLLTAEYIVTIILAAFVHFGLTPREERLSFIVPIFLVALALAGLPLGSAAILAPTGRFALIVAICSLLSAGLRKEGDAGWEARLAVGFGAFSLLCHQIGALGAAERSDKEFVAYLIAYLSFGLALFLVNEFGYTSAHEKKVKYNSSVLTFLCGLSAYLTLYILSFRVSSQKMMLAQFNAPLSTFVVFLVTTLALIAALWRHEKVRPLLKMCLLFAMALSLVVLITNPNTPAVVYGLVLNFILLAFIVCMIFYSTVIGSTFLANMAIAGFLILIVTRYFDVLWDMLSGSVLFIVTGLLALGGGYLIEKSRCRIMEAIHNEGRAGK